jgi:hypothetical protein
VQAAVLYIFRIQDSVHRHRRHFQWLELLEHRTQLTGSRRKVDVQSDVSPMRMELYELLQLAVSGHHIKLYYVVVSLF